MIDRNSPIPLYFQIKKDICHQIDTGELKEGDKLPTEYWYRDHYQVSRVTIRRAIEELVNENVLERERKKGAVVAGKKVNRQLNKMTSSYEDLKKMGVEFETKILSLKPFKATETLSQEFQMDEKEPLWEIRRLRSSEGKPVLIQLLYLRQKFCPALDKIEHLERESIYHLLEQNYHLKLDHAQQDINAMLSDKKQMKLLGLEDATAMLHIHRKGFLSDESVFEVTDLYFVGNFFKYSLILYR